ncbi:undecaprenyl/decaprenyl-phosphate alpha-N-acetylglucosaminyl 1-phosphate transferase [Sphingobacterium sp. DN00404]|uniref:Undecaprenyl/decaprenyl-phosphate alpha-N-acetylglucosaminyl 1-phosphate transferase n=1 Tax=Sphingobacterium micropteri TaxID=2763501 RepID=A0ABR7YLN8_9SPHI|nr:MraY family glycosyltransferase [Sphingobacterium micropteri]MBD1432228.1 undecaprenyl/decaprenyl-phosphate alpha-N-acetylglucosaminyl 1-phosphate transferase [Sphingobacterium micropteri]
MEILLVVGCFVVALLLSRGMIPVIMLVTYKKRLFDPVNDRKVHNKCIIPRLGGVIFVPIQCFLFVVALVFAVKIAHIEMNVQSWVFLPSFMMLLCGLGMLFMVGVVDDLIGVSYKWKFVVQICAASFFPLSGLWINDLYGLGLLVSLPAWVGMPLTMFIVVLIINAINLIDGLDGLCSGVVAMGCMVLGALFMYYGAWWHTLFAFITVGVLIPFFYYNVFGATRRRRRIFMGDTGSMTLGYSMAFLAISFAMNNPYVKPFSEGAIVVAFSTLIIPVMDVARVMFIRWRKGKPVFKPDRNHLHHKFLRMGMSHRTAMLSILGLVLFFSAFNILMVEMISNNIVILCDVALWLGMHGVFERMEKRYIQKQAMVTSQSTSLTQVYRTESKMKLKEGVALQGGDAYVQ